LPRNDLPIVLWLQGGPGAGGSGYGNFGEMGPLDANFQPREYAWTNSVNLLFIDNPVGAGYSYVDHTDLLTTNVTQISMDLLTMHKALVSKYPFMSELPYWIFSESYGGKMTANFGVHLHNAIVNGDIAMNFQGVTLGDSWISGIDYVNTWPAYLYALTLIDNQQYNELLKTANSCQNAAANGDWRESTQIWGQMEGQIADYTNNVDFYNVLTFDGLPGAQQSDSGLDVLRYHHLEAMEHYLNALNGGVNESQIAYIMNNQVRRQLAPTIPEKVIWGGQSNAVFSAQNEDFNRPVVNDVDTLLANGISVNVENGQLDLICCTLGTLEWLQTIEWKYKNEFHDCDKVGVLTPDGSDVAYFKKNYRNLSFYYIMKAGHMVPADNPIAAQMMLRDITLSGTN